MPDTYSLFFDTETTGLPLQRQKAEEKEGIWPDIVSIAWLLYKNKELVKKSHHIIKPDGWSIPDESIRFHGITQERAMKEGESLRDILSVFLEDARKCQNVLAHNMEFDKNVIMNAVVWRLCESPKSLWNPKADICTMRLSADEMKLPSKKKGSFSFVSLDKLYEDTFTKKREPGAHNADRDVEDLAEIVWSRWEIIV